MRLAFRRPFVTLVLCLGVIGCSQQKEIVAAQPTFPASPDTTVEIVAANLANNHPEIVWEALPESYRADINELTAAFAAKMDPELYDRSMALALSFIDVLQAKQDIILASETVAGTGIDVDALGARMTPALEIARSFFASEVSTTAGLAVIDWQQYLAGTVAEIMKTADAIEGEEGEDPFLAFDSVEVELLEEDGDTAVVRVTADDEEPEDVAMTKIENRWVPAEMAEQWDAKVAEGHARLEEITPEKMEELKGQAVLGFAMAEGLISQLETIETPEEFDSTFGPMLEGFVANFGNFLPPPADTGSEEPAGEETDAEVQSDEVSE
jgi:hypothetical protein